MKSQSAAILLEKIRECAVKASVYDRIFLAFGTLLGAVRPTKGRKTPYRLGVMEHDSDMDVGLLPMSSDEKFRFNRECEMAGITNGRKAIVEDKGLVWFKAEYQGAKSCVWSFFDYQGTMFHSKGGYWLKEEKFPKLNRNLVRSAKGMALGAPAKPFYELTEIEFEGVKFNVPLMTGTLLDHWYTGWHLPKGGSSEKKRILVIGDWKDTQTWRVI